MRKREENYTIRENDNIIKNLKKSITLAHYATLDIRSLGGEDRDVFLKENKGTLKQLADILIEEAENVMSWYK